MCGFDPIGEEIRHRLGLGGIDRGVPLLLAGNAIGGAQVRFDHSQHLPFQRGGVRQRKVARLLRGLLGERDDRIDHRLEMLVAEHYGTEHDLLGQLLGFRFDHQHRIACTSDDEIELTLRHFVELRIEHVFVVDEADARGADRSHERRDRERECRRRGDHRHDIRIILQIMGVHGGDHLGIAAITFGEQRPDRAVDQAGDQRLLFGRAAFPLEIASGNAAGSVEFFLVVAGERQEIDAFPRLLGGNNGGQHGGFAVGGEYRAVGLAGYPAGFQDELAPAPVELNTMNIEHGLSLSWFSAEGRKP